MSAITLPSIKGAYSGMQGEKSHFPSTSPCGGFEEEMDTSAGLKELEALKSIFNSDELTVLNDGDSGNIRAVFVVHVYLREDLTVKYKVNPECDECSYVKVKHLPPLTLHLELPENYPSVSSPRCTISCQWLTSQEITRLRDEMESIWLASGNTEIIYSWIVFLQNNTLDFLRIRDELDLTASNFVDKGDSKTDRGLGEATVTDRSESSEGGTLENFKSEEEITTRSDSDAVNDHESNPESESEVGKNCIDFKTNNKASIVDILVTYNAKKQYMEFRKKRFTCSLCFSDKMGKEFLKFQNCEHMFCRDCISNYFTVMIKEGMAKSIKCPEIDCSSEPAPHEVKNLITPKLFAKYDSMLLHSALDGMGGIIYCPRLACQYPGSMTPGETLVVCPNCYYPFCQYCKMVYHGIEKCKIDSEEANRVVQEYLNGSDEERKVLEARFGAKQMQWLVDTKQAESWIGANCKRCPVCCAPIEKDSGCSKMICQKCNTYFCWDCLSKLNPSDPYIHFQYCFNN